MRENIRQGCDMDKSTIIARLREYEGELKAAGVDHLLLHGSYARGTAIREASDVDVIADFDRNRKLSLIGRVHLENRLTDTSPTKLAFAGFVILAYNGKISGLSFCKFLVVAAVFVAVQVVHDDFLRIVLNRKALGIAAARHWPKE
jgi:predicted nucleotidyltransferase